METENKKEVSLKDLRFSGADWYGTSYNIVVGGAGTIGSNIVPLLARLGHNIYLYDMDTVEEHNLGVQLFTNDRIGEPKVNAVMILTYELSSKSIYPFNEEYTSNSMASNVMISAFDNMNARKIMFDNWVEYVNDPDNITEQCIFIDGRMDFTQFQVYLVTKDNIEKYRETLFDDNAVDTIPCSLKTTPFIGPMIAGLMSAGLCNFVANGNIGDDLYEVPFKTEFMFPNLICNSYD